MKRIALLTSGGDAPGMNAAVRAVVRVALYNGIEVMGIRRGYAGLLEKDIFMMDRSSVSDIIQRGGTVLRTARCDDFEEAGVPEKAVDILDDYGIHSLIVIGGDGSFRGAQDLAKLGVSTIGIPGTIDNDLAYTDRTIGFDTALNTVHEAVNKLRDTSTSHGRVSIIEVMGRNCGDIALYSGIACGAESIIIPEKGYDKDELIENILTGKRKGKLHNIIVLAEGVGGAYELAEYVENKTGLEARATVLGHIQRGGSPTVPDIILASRFGARAVELLIEGKSSRVVGVHENKIIDLDIDDALAKEKVFDSELYHLAEVLSL